MIANRSVLRIKETIGRIYWKLRKSLTRMGLEKFFHENLKNIEGVVLDIGAGGQRMNYSDSSKVIRLDIKEGDSIDVVADAHNLPLPDSSFDAIICKEVLEHLYHPHKAVDEMLRVLKPGGKFVGSTCFYWPIHGEPFDYFRYTKFGLEKLFERWSDVKIIPRTGIVGALAVHLVDRTPGKRHFIIKLLYLIILLAALCLLHIDKLFKSSSKLKCITTGYFVSAIKPN